MSDSDNIDTNQDPSTTPTLSCEQGTPPKPTNFALSCISQYGLFQDFTEIMPVRKEILKIPVGRTHKQNFIRVDSSKPYLLDAWLLELGSTKEVYLVSPKLQQDLAGELIPKRLYKCTTRQGDVFLWPVRIPDSQGNLDTWNTSAHEAARVAKDSWVRVVSNKEISSYDVVHPRMDLPEPKWPDITDEEFVNLAFKDRMIDSLDHPTIKKLRGEL